MKNVIIPKQDRSSLKTKEQLNAYLSRLQSFSILSKEEKEDCKKGWAEKLGLGQDVSKGTAYYVKTEKSLVKKGQLSEDK